jgi:hypothetical protein
MKENELATLKDGSLVKLRVIGCKVHRKKLDIDATPLLAVLV